MISSQQRLQPGDPSRRHIEFRLIRECELLEFKRAAQVRFKREALD